MSSVVLGKVTKLSVGLTAGSKVDFTAILGGTTNINYAITRNTRAVPAGRGRQGTQLSNYETHVITFSCDSNAQHDAILEGRSAQRVYFTADMQGSASGRKRRVGEGVITASLSIDKATGASTWSVSIAVDGAPTETTI